MRCGAEVVVATSGTVPEVVGDGLQSGLEVPVRGGGRTGLGSHEIVAGRQASGGVEGGHGRAESATEAVADDRVADRATNPVRHAHARIVDAARRGEVADAQWSAAHRSAIVPKGIEIAPERESPDQAERRVRPFWRRALMMARPARVRMRWRKPCLRARLRLFGW